MSGIYRGPASSVAAQEVAVDGDKGDITVSSSGTVWTIDPNAVTYAKIQDVSATDKLLGRSSVGSGDIEEIPCTAAGRALLDDADSTAQRTTLGLGTIATQNANNVNITGGAVQLTTALPVASGGTGAADAGTARTNLGLTIGTNVLAYDANLQGFVDTFTLPTVDAAANTVLATNGLGTLSFVAQGGVPDGDKGDITVSGGGTVWTVDPLAITAGKLAANSVETAKIADLNVTNAKLNDLAVTAAKLASDSVTTAKILDANITTAKIADLNVTNAKLANSYINDLTTVTIDPINDLVAIADASDTGNKKKALLPKGMVLLATYTAASSASINITEGFDGNYSHLEFVFENILPATNAVNFISRISTNGGSSYLATATYFTSTLVNNGATATAASADSLNQWTLNAATLLSNTGGETFNGKMQLFSPAVVGARAYATSLGTYRTSSANNAVSIRGMFTTNTGINAIQFLMDSGNIASGKIYVYGYRK